MAQGMTRRPKALIIGGGIAGPVTGIFLKRAGIDSEVFEAWPYSTGIGGGLQIAPNGMHVLAEIGLASEMIRRGSVCESFDFYSQSGRQLGSLNRNMEERFTVREIDVTVAGGVPHTHFGIRVQLDGAAIL